MNQKYLIAHNITKKLLGLRDTLESAQQFSEEEHPGEAFVVQTKKDLSKFDNRELLKLYNELTSRNTKMFNSYKAGLNQVWKFLSPRDGAETPELTPKLTETKEVNKMSMKKKSTAKKVAQKKVTQKKVTQKKASAKKASAKKLNGPRVSYAQKLHTLFRTKSTKLTMDEIADKLDTNRKNASVAISLAKNPDRVSDPIVISRIPGTDQYSRDS
jgi:hypothetical protein